MARAWTVTAARYATLETTRSDVYHRYSAYGEPDGPARLDYYFWVLRDAAGGETLLVDTGFHPDAGRRRGRTCVIEPAAAMAQLGITPDTVSRVVLTHLHYDHTGNLDVLPDAELLVPARELEFWFGPFAQRLQFADAVEGEELERVRAADEAGRVRRLDGEQELADGVTAIVLGGHTPGQAVLRVETAQGLVVLASDAVHFYEEFELDRPFAIIADLAQVYAAYDTLRALCAGPESHLVPGHDAAVMDRYPRVEGPAGDFAVQIR
jgi:glyoxylase-like metal-dependent hydrolase (beta-lactamase superfamily II)